MFRVSASWFVRTSSNRVTSSRCWELLYWCLCHLRCREQSVTPSRCISVSMLLISNFCLILGVNKYNYWPSWPTRHVRRQCRNISVNTSRHKAARGHCDRRPRHCCMSRSDELLSANALSALQHHLSGTLSLSLFRTVTGSHYFNLDLKHICSPPSMLLNCPVRQCLWSHGNTALYKFCIIIIIIFFCPLGTKFPRVKYWRLSK